MPRPRLGLLALSHGRVHIALIAAVATLWLVQIEVAIRNRWSSDLSLLTGEASESQFPPGADYSLIIADQDLVKR
jgi:hypothetical protein